MIHLIMLTGFLGAGKTTLLRSMIEEFKEEKIAVIINEFGSVSIDAEIVRQDSIEMAELSNGSIFCACIKESFVETLIRLSHRDIRYLFIEASGLADPASMPAILEGIRPHLGQEYRYTHSLCVVDGVTFCEMSELLVALNRQVSSSDYVIVNKSDLFTEDQYQRCLTLIRSENPTAHIICTSYCRFDIRGTVESPSGLTGAWQPSTNTYESRPVTLVLRERKPISRHDLTAFLGLIAGSAYRIKGFLNTPDGAVEVSCVGEQISVTPWKRSLPAPQLVVISGIGIRIVSAVTAAMRETLHGELSL